VTGLTICTRQFLALNRRLKCFCLFIGLFITSTAGFIQAQEPIVSGDSLLLVENTFKKVSKNANFTILPGPVYNSSNRLGFMILPVLVYNLRKEDKLSPPSSTALMIYFDLNGSWMLAARQNLFWNQDKWRASLFAGYGEFRAKFFGVGRDTMIINNNDSNYVWSRLNGFNANMTCYRKIISQFYGGLQYIYSSTNLNGTDSISAAKIEQQGLTVGKSTENILIPSLIWDNRDNIFWTVKGYYASLTLQLANAILFSSSSYSILTGFVNGYHKILPDNNRLTLAWHVYTQLGWGTLPYTRMAIFGRGDNTTGYTRGKYVNNSEITAQAEIRYDVWKFIGVGGYIGTGKIFSTFETFGQSVWLTFGGARFYVNVLPTRNLRLRLDIAVGRKDFGVYVGVGQAF